MLTASKEAILAAVCNAFAITEAELIGGRRYKRLSEARKAAAHYLRLYTSLSNKQIGKLFRRSPCWASWAYFGATDQAEVDRMFADRCKTVQDLLDRAAGLCHKSNAGGLTNV